MAKKTPTGLYDTGYCKPPVDTRFQKGASGNPRGRPKGSRNLATLVARVFSRTVVAQDNGRQRRISVAEAMVTKIMAKAVSGDIAAQRLGISLLQASETDAPPVATLLASEDDRALLRAALLDQVAEPMTKPRRARSRKGVSR